MSFMPTVGTQIVLTDGRHAWVANFTPKHGEDDRVVFEDGHQEQVEVMTGIRAILGEEMPKLVLDALIVSAIANKAVAKELCDFFEYEMNRYRRERNEARKRALPVYLVNYGMTPENYLSSDKRFASLRRAMREAASSVRELGLQSWATVYREGGDDTDLLASWQNGRRQRNVGQLNYH